MQIFRSESSCGETADSITASSPPRMTWKARMRILWNCWCWVSGNQGQRFHLQPACIVSPFSLHVFADGTHGLHLLCTDRPAVGGSLLSSSCFIESCFWKAMTLSGALSEMFLISSMPLSFLLSSLTFFPLILFLSFLCGN